MLSAGQLVGLTIEKPVAGGRMIARVDGQIVLVSGAIPSEHVTARVTSVARGVVFAEAVEILSSSPDRRDPACDPGCGGNLYAHIAYPAQLSLKAAVLVDALTRIGRLTWTTPIDVASSPVGGYRMRAKLHLRQGRLGFFREDTHAVCDARATGQLLPASCDVIDHVAGALGPALGSAEIEIAENLDASQRAVHIETLEADLVARVMGRGDVVPGVTGLSVGSPDPNTPVRTLLGTPWVTDVLEVQGAQVGLRRHVRGFFQGNRYLLTALVSHVCDLVPERARVTDLYAGVGVFGLAVAATRRASVVAVEGDRYAAADLDANATLMGGVEVSHQSVESFLSRRRPAPDVVVVDPPRTGLSHEALGGVVTLAAAHLVYVSCDVATLARDTRRLVDAGYRIQSIRAFDLFPNTPHVETVVDLRR